ncbi:MAG: tRNA-dihydrouridine synthase [Victivallaceae bacterium]
MNNIYPANSIILAPLSGYTDLPYRNSARRFGCGFCFTEMIDAGSLAYGNSKTTRLVDRGPGEEWLGVQLVGSDHGRIKLAVEILNEHDFDVLDFNLGCPFRKWLKKEPAPFSDRILMRRSGVLI